MNRFKLCVLSILSKEDADKWMQWAFGPGYRDLPIIEYMDSWNKLHSDELMLHKDGVIQEDIQKCIDLWRSKGEQ